MDDSSKGKFIFGVCKVGERGQIVIPKDARKVFNINPGDNLVLLGDIEKGMALVKTEILQDITNEILKGDKDDSN